MPCGRDVDSRLIAGDRESDGCGGNVKGENGCQDREYRHCILGHSPLCHYLDLSTLNLMSEL